MLNLRTDIAQFLRDEWERLDALETHRSRSRDDEARWRALRRADEGSLEEQGLISILEECLRKFSTVNLQSHGLADVPTEGSRLR